MSEDPDVPFDVAFEAPPGTLVRLSPLVRRIVAPNPGPMTFKGTCTYVVGHGAVAVIDPGPELPEHIDALLRGLGTERVAQILVTHTHRDHSPAARLLQAATGAPVIGCGPHITARAPTMAETAAVQRSNDLDYKPDRILADGEIFDGVGFTLQAVATPGHTMNHLAFALPEEATLFSGDHVMAWSTTVIVPPSGSMGAYRASLEGLRGRSETLYWPGHGGPVREPQRFIRALLQHRRQRDVAIFSRLRAGDTTIAAIVARIYEGLDPRLTRAASLSVQAHLEEMIEKGSVIADGPPSLDAAFRLTDPVSAHLSSDD
ncbi:MBL fold metallo-hydrolase [Beijerinckia sp. L45]|uniref:MBL fold metallo-hydrolase n=1 Tax=Beijerinckia sp. L45 TaxID=1641855 RepID=UPI00131D1C34|nr:MBL fold metallo-hydrolase [Beijerinckia sp. L45]